MTTRVLQVLGRSAGGIAKHVAQITRALDGDGLQIDVACPPGLPVEMPKPTTDLEIPNGLRGHSGAIRKLRAIVAAGGYDLVHAHGLRAGIDAALAARGRAPVVVTVHNLVRSEIAGRRAPIDRWAEPLVVRLCARTLTVSEEIAAHLRAAAPGSAGKIEVLYLGIGDAPEVRRDRASIRAELGVPDGGCLVVTVARLAPQKALPVMFEALRRSSAPATLALLGEGPLESELRALSGRMGLSERIRFLGFRDDVADYVAAADVFALSSTWEGVPLAVQEAILLGTPVISTNVGGMSEIVTDRVSGALVPAGDADGLAAALDEVCSSPATAAGWAARARSDLLRRFSTEAMLARLSAIYLGGPDAS